MYFYYYKAFHLIWHDSLYSHILAMTQRAILCRNLRWSDVGTRARCGNCWNSLEWKVCTDWTHTLWCIPLDLSVNLQEWFLMIVSILVHYEKYRIVIFFSFWLWPVTVIPCGYLDWMRVPILFKFMMDPELVLHLHVSVRWHTSDHVICCDEMYKNAILVSRCIFFWIS